MEASFYQANRKAPLDFLPDNSAAVLFSGHAPRQSADAYYPFFCSRNFLYLTGVDFEGFVLYLFSIIKPGMVFCVDIGIYDEDSGIGFRLEDNCLVTENGCENLSASIPRKLEDIEAAMAK